MSKKNIEKHIPNAITVIKDKFDNNPIPSAYNGYISQFGASVIQSGLKVTIALFENQNASTDEDKTVLMKLILKILDKNHEGTLLSYVIKKDDDYILKQEILDIAVAIKLSLRTFKLQKGESDE